MVIDLNTKIFHIISEVLKENNMRGFVIGGYVRDLLLERPSKDIDIVVLGSGIKAAENVAKKVHKDIKVNVFKRFGTAQFKYKSLELEFVGARKESYRTDSRKPIVENGSLEDDQNRRDFTINALAIDLTQENFGALIDPFNGLDDLESKIIKTPLEPDVTFSDDPLRMLRAVRFACQLNFEIYEKTFNSIQKNSTRLKIVSRERITDELNKIMLSKNPSLGLKLLEESGLLDYILPELQSLKGVDEMDGNRHKDNFYHTLQVIDNVAEKSDDLWLRWAALFHDIAKPATKKYDSENGWTFHGHEYLGAKMIPKVFKRLRLPLNDKMKYVQKLVQLHLRPIALVSEEVTDSAVRRLLFDAGDDIDDLMQLCEADITSGNRNRVERYLKNFKLVRKKLADIEEKDRVRNFQPPISGELIMETFNIAPSKEIGLIKNAIKEAILEGEISNNYDEAYNYMLNYAKSIGLKRN